MIYETRSELEKGACFNSHKVGHFHPDLVDSVSRLVRHIGSLNPRSRDLHIVLNLSSKSELPRKLILGSGVLATKNIALANEVRQKINDGLIFANPNDKPHGLTRTCDHLVISVDRAGGKPKVSAMALCNRAGLAMYGIHVSRPL